MVVVVVVLMVVVVMVVVVMGTIVSRAWEKDWRGGGMIG